MKDEESRGLAKEGLEKAMSELTNKNSRDWKTLPRLLWLRKSLFFYLFTAQIKKREPRRSHALSEVLYLRLEDYWTLFCWRLICIRIELFQVPFHRHQYWKVEIRLSRLP